MRLSIFRAASLVAPVFLMAAGAALAQPAMTFSGLTKADYELGPRQYLVFFQDGETGEISKLSLWTRTTRLVEQDGEMVVEVIQDWYGNEPRSRRHIVSHNRLDTFAPIDHFARQGTEEESIEAFVFGEASIEGDPSVPGNARAGFAMESAAETQNWELDIETLALLPLGTKDIFHLNFYHPGSKTAPAVYAYEVIGDEELTGIDGQKLDTWMLKIDYNEKSDAIFWLSKETGQVLKTRDSWRGNYRFKIRLGVVGGVPEAHQ